MPLAASWFVYPASVPRALVLSAALLLMPSEAQPQRYASVRAARAGAISKPTRKRSKRVRRPPPPPLVPTVPLGVVALRSDLQALMSTRVKTGTWGVVVTSVTTGDTLVSHNADVGFMPASTQKLFTTVLAFDRLGVQHQLSTDVLRDGAIDASGTLRGSLILRGGGDPSLSSRYRGGMPEGAMRELARVVSTAGITRITGDIVGDATAFESRRVPEGWLSRYLDASYAARVSALSLNENLLHVAITPNGGRTQVALRPALSGFTIVNNSKVRGRTTRARLSVSRRGDRTIVVSGWIGTRANLRVYTVVVDDPAKYATAAFRKALEEAGVTVEGATTLGATPTSAVAIGSLPSPPLVELVRVMNGDSDNHFAELLLRDAARGPDGAAVGSAQLANEQLRSLLGERAGSMPHSIKVADGSGLSSANRITPRAQTELLMYAHRAPWAREFESTLPVAGMTETLRHRMNGSAAHGNLKAKTGTTNDAIALSGYVTARSGELLAFSMLYNGREGYNARETIDAMGATLAGFTR